MVIDQKHIQFRTAFFEAVQLDVFGGPLKGAALEGRLGDWARGRQRKAGGSNACAYGQGLA